MATIEFFDTSEDALEAAGLQEQAMSHENVDSVLRSLESWNRGDVDGWLELADPDLEFRTSSVYPGTDVIYRGQAELRRFWTAFREPWESLHIDVDQAREVGDDVVVLASFESHGRDGISVQREVAWIWRFVDEVAARVDAYASWEAALEATGLSEQHAMIVRRSSERSTKEPVI